MVHNENVENICLKIFDTLKKCTNLTKRDRLILQIAAILHTCGSFISLKEIGENSFKIIMSTEIIGLSHKERVMVAYIVRYINTTFPKYAEIQDVFDRDNFVKITKLNAILRLSASMDKSHQQKFKDISVNLDNNTLTVTGKTLYDITLEQGMFKLNSDFFEELYGIKPILKQKKEF